MTTSFRHRIATRHENNPQGIHAGGAEARIVILGKLGLSISLPQKSATTIRPSRRWW